VLNAQTICFDGKKIGKKADLAMNALRMALKIREPYPDLVFPHRCSGSYKARKFRSLLKRYRARLSMAMPGIVATMPLQIVL
jgi:hypothetical protein